MSDFWLAFLFFLPAGLANVAPILLNKAPGLKHFNTPVDFGKSWHGKRILGDNKTWRGIIGGTLMGALAGVVVYKFYNLPFDTNHALLGGLLGLGAIAGDTVKSFFKRRLGKESGDSWLFFDQADYVVGGLVVSSLLVRLKSWWQVGAILLLWTLMSLLFSYLGYLIKLKDKPI